MDFGPWLGQEMKKRRLSQRELSRLSGVAQGLISEVINQKREPSQKFVTAVAAALGEPPEKLLRIADILPPADEDDTLQELIELARNMSPEDRKAVLEFARFKFRKSD